MKYFLIFSLIAVTTFIRPGFAEEPFQPLSLAGTVIADNKTGLSYGARGCIIEISPKALRSSNTTAEQILVRLDDRAATLAVKTAKARLSDLQAALDERNLAVTVVKS